MKCPDDCGDVLTLNADPKAGKAWRVYQRNGNVTLFPSVWRTEGCKSHFIVSRGSIYWAGAEVFDDTPDPHLLRAVESLLKRVGRAGFWELADELGEMPWDVLFALRTLVGAGRAIEVPRDSGQFELVP